MGIDKNKADKEKILEQALKDVPFDGWSMATFEAAATRLGFDPIIVKALFPRGLADTLTFFGQWADDHMIDALHTRKTDDLGMTDKVKLAVETRIEFLTPYKEAVRMTAKLMARPNYTRTGAQITWNTADRIWIWAGDTSTDYNRYTKRGLLSGVIGSTMLYWLTDNSDNFEKSRVFLENRIQNVLFIGKNAAPLLKPVASFMERVMMRGKA